MSAINTNIQHGGYYQLNNSGAGASNANGTNRSGGAASGLAAALHQQNTGGFSDAVFLDLSPAAQQYLSGLSAASAQPKSASSTTSEGFVLDAKQKHTISEILEKYKDAPYTQETFDAIQDDLQRAGLSPDQLSAKERVSSFSSTAVLIDALNGGNGTTPGSQPVTNDELSRKASAYVQDITAQWKKLAAESKDDSTENADAVSGVSDTSGAS